MGNDRYALESIVEMLRDIEVLMGQGQPWVEVVRQQGISGVHFYDLQAVFRFHAG